MNHTWKWILGIALAAIFLFVISAMWLFAMPYRGHGMMGGYGWYMPMMWLIPIGLLVLIGLAIAWFIRSLAAPKQKQ